MGKPRVHEIAKKYNKQSKEIIEILKKNNIEVKNHMSTVEDAQVTVIEKALGAKNKPDRITVRTNPETSRAGTSRGTEDSRDLRTARITRTVAAKNRRDSRRIKTAARIREAKRRS